MESRTWIPKAVIDKYHELAFKHEKEMVNIIHTGFRNEEEYNKFLELKEKTKGIFKLYEGSDFNHPEVQYEFLKDLTKSIYF